MLLLKLVFCVLRLERALCHYNLLYDHGFHGDGCLDNGVLLQQVSSVTDESFTLCLSPAS